MRSRIDWIDSIYSEPDLLDLLQELSPDEISRWLTLYRGWKKVRRAEKRIPLISVHFRCMVFIKSIDDRTFVLFVPTIKTMRYREQLRGVRDRLEIVKQYVKQIELTNKSEHPIKKRMNDIKRLQQTYSSPSLFDLLQEMEPSAIACWLVACQGWQKSSTLEDRAWLFEKKIDGNCHKILLPKTRTVDYNLRLFELWEKLEQLRQIVRKANAD